MSIVQSKAGGYGSGTTSAVGFDSNTTAGNTLVCVVWAEDYGDDISCTLSFSTPVTSGITWALAGTNQWAYNTGTGLDRVWNSGGVAVYLAINAPSILTSATTSAYADSVGDNAPDVEFSLYELSGIKTTGTLEDCNTAKGSGGVANAGALSTSDDCLIFSAMHGTTSLPTAGSGFTLGVNAAHQQYGTSQYNLDESGGSPAVAFATTEAHWAAVAVALKAGVSASASPSGIALTSAIHAPTTKVGVQPSGLSAASAIHNPSTKANSNISVIGVTAASAIGLAQTNGASQALPLGLSLVSAMGIALPGGAHMSVSPVGLTLHASVGSVTAGVPINYGNVVSGSAALPAGVHTKYFYVRWTGWITPAVSGVYTLGLNVADGADMYCVSQFVVNVLTASQSANSSAAYTQSSTIELTANVAYPFVIEWQHGGGTSYECQLLWTPPIGAPGAGVVAVIPAKYLSLSGKWWNGTAAEWYPTTWY